MEINIHDRKFLQKLRNLASTAAYRADETGGTKFGFIDAYYALADAADRLDSLLCRSIVENSKELSAAWEKENDLYTRRIYNE